jgi:hypothetical protein
VGITRLILIFLDPADIEIFVKEVLPEMKDDG